MAKKTTKATAVEAAAGISDIALTKATKHGWDHWLEVLDGFGVARLGHKATAEFLHKEHKLSGWWAQMVTVGYERVRGLREVDEELADEEPDDEKSDESPTS